MKRILLAIFLGSIFPAAQAAPLAVKISNASGQPQLLVNGQPQVPMSFMGWALDAPQRTAADARWRHVTLQFVAQADTTSGFQIYLNRLDENLPGSVWLDDMHFYAGTPDKRTGEEQIPQGVFEFPGDKFPSNWTFVFGRNSGADAEWHYDSAPAVSGHRSLRVDIRSNPPTGALRVEVKGLHMSQGQTYTVDFQIRSTAPGYVDVMPLENGHRVDRFGQPEESLYARQVRLAASHGVHHHQFSYPIPAIGAADEAVSYDELDRAMAATIHEDPQALVTIRLGVDLGGEWRQPFPDDRETMSDGSKFFLSPSSDRWRRTIVPALEKTIRHAEEKWGDRVAIYMLSGKNTGEWFYPAWEKGLIPGFAPVTRDHFRLWLQRKYQTPGLLSAAWGRKVGSFDQIEVPTVKERQTASLGEFFDPRKDGAQIDFFDFYNDEMADALSLLAATAKKACDGRKPVLAFYGYLFSLSDSRAGLAHSGHLKWSRLLRDPNIDAFCAPNAYTDREPGGPGTFHGPVDALAPYGKFWFCEDDTLTIADPATKYPLKRCQTDEQVMDIHRRNFAQDFPRGFGNWFMDLRNAGWLLNDSLWQNIGTMARFWEQHLAAPAPYHPEIVLLGDEVSPLYLRSDTPINGPLLSDLPRTLALVGAPVGWSLLGTFLDGKVPPAKLYIFANAFVLTAEQRARAQEILRQQKATALWFYAPGYIDPAARTARVDTMKQLTGMDIFRLENSPAKKLRLTADAACVWDDLAVKWKNKALARWQVRPAVGVETLAVYDDKQKSVSAASVQRNGWRSVYVASPGAPVQLLRQIARDAGVWLYDDSGDTVMGGGDFLGIHAASDGEKTVRLPHTSVVKDVLTGKIVTTGDHVALPMKRGETRLFWFGE